MGVEGEEATPCWPPLGDEIAGLRLTSDMCLGHGTVGLHSM